MNKFTKQPAEEYVIGVEFLGRLPTGTSLSFGTVSATDLSGADVTGTILTSPTATISGTQARAKAKAGVHGQDYRIRFVLTLNNSDILEEDLTMEVRNKE